MTIETDKNITEKFVHLHLHTQYSPLDGAIKIKELIPRLKELGMSSCAITDHGNMFGAAEFYKICSENGIHPIIGSEFYISPTSRYDKNKQTLGAYSYYHLILLAENNTGLQNLYKLSTIGYLEGFYKKPRIDKEALAKYSEGIIALSACLAGEIARKIINENYTSALNAALEYDKIMGHGNFFLEIQENGIPEQIIVNKQLISISNETGIPLAATCDCHYMRREDNKAHNILMKIQHSSWKGKRAEDRPEEDEENAASHAPNANDEKLSRRKTKKDNPKPKRSDEISLNFFEDLEETPSFSSNTKENNMMERKRDKANYEYSEELYVKSPEEMEEAFNYCPEAVKNTVEISKRCNISMTFGHYHLPKYEVPEGYTLASYFEELSRKGLEKRLLRIPKEKHQIYWERLERELKVIIMKGFDGYYLIVWDFINYSRSVGIPVGPGRGSGAGSLVAYALQITDIDPIRFNLLFERFLNPERKSNPDFDIDFCVKRRDEVVEYVADKYGRDKVCQIVTFGYLKPKGSVRDVCRILDVSPDDSDKLAKAIPDGPSITNFDKAIEKDPTLVDVFKEFPRGMEILKYARNIEGLIRQAGKHAAGVIIADKPVIEYSPQCFDKDKKIMTQYEKNMAEEIGLIKFDFLGLKNLTIIDDAVKRIKAKLNPEFDIDKIPWDDKEIFERLQKGDSIGVFQFESEGMQALLKRLKPTVIEDLIAANALYRPGPMGSGMLDSFVNRKQGREPISYDLPELEDILKETYGVIVYQEQVMQIACALAGYTLGSADVLRKAMGKKKKDVMAQQRIVFLEGNEKTKKENEKLIPGAKALGIDTEKAAAVYDLMAQFAEYGFNKSHSAAYAVVAYQTAYLKIKYPLQYMAALITGALDKIDDVVKYIYECANMEIRILPPDINKSYYDFREEDGNIRFGLGAIKGAGEQAITSFIEEREKNGHFKSIYDFANRLDYKNINKKSVEALIKAGAFDSTGRNRNQLLIVFEKALAEGSAKFKMKEKGFFTIEDYLTEEEKADEIYPDVKEMSEKELLSMEKDILGFYFSSHPLKEIRNLIEAVGDNTAKIKTMGINEKIVTIGIIKNFQRKITKKSEPMATINFEDLYGSIEVVVFPKIYAAKKDIIIEDEIICVKGRISSKNFDRGRDDNEENNDINSDISIIADEIFTLDDALENFTRSMVIQYDISKFNAEGVLQLQNILREHKGALPLKIYLKKPDSFSVTLRLPESMYIKPSPEMISKLSEIPGFIKADAVSLRNPNIYKMPDYDFDYDTDNEDMYGNDTYELQESGSL